MKIKHFLLLYLLAFVMSFSCKDKIKTKADTTTFLTLTTDYNYFFKCYGGYEFEDEIRLINRVDEVMPYLIVIYNNGDNGSYRYTLLSTNDALLGIDEGGLLIYSAITSQVDLEPYVHYIWDDNSAVYILSKYDGQQTFDVQFYDEYFEDLGVENISDYIDIFNTDLMTDYLLEKEYWRGFGYGELEGYQRGLENTDNWNWTSIFYSFFTLEIFPNFKFYYLLLFSLGLIVFRGISKAVFH